MKMSAVSRPTAFVQMDLLSWTSSVAAFPARTSASPDATPVLTETALASGSNTPVSSRKSGRRGSSSRTSQPFVLADWTASSAASLRSGMMRSGTAYPLEPSALLIKETVSGSWPTPRSEDGESTGMSAARLATRKPDNLPTAVRMWPTPTAGMANYDEPVETWYARKEALIQKGINGNGAGLTLGIEVRSSVQTTSAERLQGVSGGVLHPEWVEKLMGFPVGWTELDQWKPGKATRRGSSRPAPSTGALG